MTDRDRLIELFKKTEYTPFPEMTMKSNLGNQFTDYALNCIVDEFIENGMILPPVNIGDSLWTIHYNRPKEWKVVYIGFNGEEWHINVYWYKDKDNFATRQIQSKFIDELFYRSKEEVEKELKNRAKFK